MCVPAQIDSIFFPVKMASFLLKLCLKSKYSFVSTRPAIFSHMTNREPGWQNENVLHPWSSTNRCITGAVKKAHVIIPCHDLNSLDYFLLRFFSVEMFFLAVCFWSYSVCLFGWVLGSSSIGGWLILYFTFFLVLHWPFPIGSLLVSSSNFTFYWKK